MAANPITDSIKAIIDAIEANQLKFKKIAGIKGAEVFNDLSTAFYSFSKIDWTKFGKKAAAGLESFEGLSDNIVTASKALEGLDANTTKNAQAFAELSSALTIFSGIGWLGVMKGVLMMSAIPKLLKASAAGFAAAGQAVKGLAEHKESFAALESLLTAFRQFADIKWAQVAKGLLVMGVISPFFSNFGKSVESLAKSLSSRGKKAIESFVSFANALNTFANVKWSRVLFGITAMKLVGGMLKAFGETTKVIASAITSFNKVATAGAVVIGTFVNAIGAFALSPTFWLGIAALASLGFVLMEFGAAAALTGIGVLALAFGFEKLAANSAEVVGMFLQFAANAAGIFAAAAAIGAVSVALVAFGAASIASGISGAISGVIGSVTGSNPIDQILKLAESSDKLDKAATALERIKAAMSGMPSSAGMDLSSKGIQSAELASRRNVASTGGVGAIIKTGAKSISNQVSSVVVNTGWMPDRSSALILAPAM